MKPILRLAARSLVFERGYVASTLCRPSVASILTGTFPNTASSAMTSMTETSKSILPKPRRKLTEADGNFLMSGIFLWGFSY
jgi:arylsulfatase A-like enzyme